MDYQKLKDMQFAVRFLQGRFDSGREDGGPGSGNWGHAGRPGQIGGSASKESGMSGSVANRYKTPDGGYTSFAKERRKVATPHQTSTTELRSMPVGTRLMVDGKAYTKIGDTKWQDKDGNEIGSYTLNKSECWEKKVKLAVPKSAEAEFMKDKGEKGAVSEKPKKSKEPKKEEPKSTFSSSYSEERLANARRLKGNESLEVYKDNIENAWSTFDQETKDDLYKYTTGSSFVNEPLHEISYVGPKYGGSQAIKNLTAAIDKCEIPEDTYLYHSLKTDGFMKTFGITDMSKSTLDSLVGKFGSNNGFTSCGASEGHGWESEDYYDTKPVKMEIFAPKGTKGIYVEPFSHYGKGADSSSWDGKITQTEVGKEDELILQRGGQYKFVGWNYSGGEYHIQVQLVGQDPSFDGYEPYTK